MPDLRGFLSFRRFLAEDTTHAVPTDMANMSSEELHRLWASQAYLRGGRTNTSFNHGRALKAAATSVAKDQIDNVVGGVLGNPAGTAAQLGAGAVEGGSEAGAGNRAAGVARGLATAGLNAAADAVGLGGVATAARAGMAYYQGGQQPEWMHAKKAAEDAAAANGVGTHAFQLDQAGDQQILKELGEPKLTMFYKMLVMPKYIEQGKALNRADPTRIPDDYAIRFARQFMRMHGKTFAGGPAMNAPAADMRPAEKSLPRTAPVRQGYRPGVSNQPLPSQGNQDINWLG